MQLTSLFSIVACISLVGARTIKQCIRKSEAAAFVQEFITVWDCSSGCDEGARRIATPDFVLKSGSITTLMRGLVGEGDAVVFASRADWIAFLESGTPLPSQIEELHLDIVGCSTVIFQYKGKFNGFTVMAFERFDLIHVEGRWAMYSTEVEFDSLADAGGYAGACSAA